MAFDVPILVCMTVSTPVCLDDEHGASFHFRYQIVTENKCLLII